jgi:hypothetical protein
VESVPASMKQPRSNGPRDAPPRERRDAAVVAPAEHDDPRFAAVHSNPRFARFPKARARMSWSHAPLRSAT